jgi:hypothetical protein
MMNPTWVFFFFLKQFVFWVFLPENSFTSSDVHFYIEEEIYIYIYIITCQ